MAFTYVDPTSGDRDKVRFLIQDTDSTDPHLQDAEITYLVSVWGNVYRAAAYAADAKPDNDAELAQAIADAKDFVDKCQSSNKYLNHYSTAESARDMDILRAALGDKKLNYLGKSYGTYLGTIYAQLFPDKDWNSSSLSERALALRYFGMAVWFLIWNFHMDRLTLR